MFCEKGILRKFHKIQRKTLVLIGTTVPPYSILLVIWSLSFRNSPSDLLYKKAVICRSWRPTNFNFNNNGPHEVCFFMWILQNFWVQLLFSTTLNKCLCFCTITYRCVFRTLPHIYDNGFHQWNIFAKNSILQMLNRILNMPLTSNTFSNCFGGNCSKTGNDCGFVI